MLCTYKWKLATKKGNLPFFFISKWERGGCFEGTKNYECRTAIMNSYLPRLSVILLIFDRSAFKNKLCCSILKVTTFIEFHKSLPLFDIQGSPTKTVSTSMNSTSTNCSAIDIKFILVEFVISKFILVKFSLCTTKQVQILHT